MKSLVFDPYPFERRENRERFDIHQSSGHACPEAEKSELQKGAATNMPFSGELAHAGKLVVPPTSARQDRIVDPEAGVQARLTEPAGEAASSLMSDRPLAWKPDPWLFQQRKLQAEHPWLFLEPDQRLKPQAEYTWLFLKLDQRLKPQAEHPWQFLELDRSPKPQAEHPWLFLEPDPCNLIRYDNCRMIMVVSAAYSF
jgi:hypothetical protein